MLHSSLEKKTAAKLAAQILYFQSFNNTKFFEPGTWKFGDLPIWTLKQFCNRN